MAIIASVPGCGGDSFAARTSAAGDWRRTPVARGAVGDGFSGLNGVRVSRWSVFVAGASYRADRVHAIGFDLGSSRWSPPVASPLRVA